MGNLAWPVHLARTSVDYGRKPEHLEETHTDTGRMCKLDTDSCPRVELILGPWCCEAATLTTEPPCHPKVDESQSRHFQSEPFFRTVEGEGSCVALDKAQDGRGIKGMRGEVELVSDRKVVLIIVYREQMLHKSGTESALGLTDVEEATSGATDTVDQVGGYVAELDELEVRDHILAGDRVRGGVAQVAMGVGGFEIDIRVELVTGDGEGGIGDGPGEFEVGVNGVSKVDELFKLVMEARGRADSYQCHGGKGRFFVPQINHFQIVYPSMVKTMKRQAWNQYSSLEMENIY
eukprot:g43074.t1